MAALTDPVERIVSADEDLDVCIRRVDAFVAAIKALVKTFAWAIVAVAIASAMLLLAAAHLVSIMIEAGSTGGYFAMGAGGALLAGLAALGRYLLGRKKK